MILPYSSFDENASTPPQPDPRRRRALRCLLGALLTPVLGLPLVAGAARTRSNGFAAVSEIDAALFPCSARRRPSLREAAYYRPLLRGEPGASDEARLDRRA